MIDNVKNEVVPTNRGDLALSPNRDEVVDRARIKNISNFSRNVLPGDVTNRKDPVADYAYFWFLDANSEFSEEELDFLKEAGYAYVNFKDFDVKRWTEHSDGRVRSGRYFLQCIPQKRYDSRQLDKLRALGAVLDTQVESFHDTADRAGAGTWEMRGGQKRDVVKSKRSH